MAYEEKVGDIVLGAAFVEGFHRSWVPRGEEPIQVGREFGQKACNSSVDPTRATSRFQITEIGGFRNYGDGHDGGPWITVVRIDGPEERMFYTRDCGRDTDIKSEHLPIAAPVEEGSAVSFRGSSHKTNQDFAEARGGCIVVSDGCSSTKDTDWGSRILSRFSLKHRGIVPQVLSNASFAAGACGLAPEALDATLLFAEKREGEFRIQIVGDGVVAARRRDGHGFAWVRVEFPSGAPRYLSYDSNPTRRKAHLDAFGRVMQVTKGGTGSLFIERESFTLEDNNIKPHKESFSTEVFDMVVLLTGGVLSFTRPLGESGMRESVPFEEVLAGVFSAQNTSGDFLADTLRGFVADAHRKGWTHDEDFSAAGLVAR